MWDFGGQRVFYALHHAFLTRYGCYLVVFNMQNMLGSGKAECMRYIRGWLRCIALHAKGAPVALVGTRKDKVQSRDDWLSISETLETVMQECEAYRDLTVVTHRADSLNFFPVDNKSGEDDTVRALASSWKSRARGCEGLLESAHPAAVAARARRASEARQDPSDDAQRRRDRALCDGQMRHATQDGCCCSRCTSWRAAVLRRADAALTGVPGPPVAHRPVLCVIRSWRGELAAPHRRRGAREFRSSGFFVRRRIPSLLEVVIQTTRRTIRRGSDSADDKVRLICQYDAARAGEVSFTALRRFPARRRRSGRSNRRTAPRWKSTTFFRRAVGATALPVRGLLCQAWARCRDA